MLNNTSKHIEKLLLTILHWESEIYLICFIKHRKRGYKLNCSSWNTKFCSLEKKLTFTDVLYICPKIFVCNHIGLLDICQIRTQTWKSAKSLMWIFSRIPGSKILIFYILNSDCPPLWFHLWAQTSCDI